MLCSELARSPAVLEFVEQHRDEDPARLALRFAGKVPFPLPAVLEHIAVLKRARDKLPTLAARGCWFTKRAYEQSTSERLADYKADTIQADRALDACAGLGVDAWALSKRAGHVDVLDVSAESIDLLSHNAERLGWRPASARAADLEATLSSSRETWDLIYVDPDRRPAKQDEPGSGGRRVAALEECRPNVQRLLPLLRSRCERLHLKLSPMLDPQSLLESLCGVSRVRALGTGNEVKELAVEMRAGTTAEPVLSAEEPREKGPPFRLEATFGERGGPVDIATRGDLLLEPARVVLRARLERHFARTLGVPMIDPGAAYYLTDRVPAGFHGRAFTVLERSSYRPDALRRWLAQQGIREAAISRRNFPSTTREIRERLRLREGGEHHLLFAESAVDGKLCFVTRPFDPGPTPDVRTAR